MAHVSFATYVIGFFMYVENALALQLLMCIRT